MKYWLDTEFIEDGRTIDLISVGMVSEDGRELYRVLKSFSKFNFFGNPWLVENVLPNLPITKLDKKKPWSSTNFDIHNYDPVWINRSELREEILDFCSTEKYGKPEFWGYYADYDWVALCQLFGTMMDLPKGWPMYCRDIKQWCDDLGNPQLPEQGKSEHHALADAKWNRQAWYFLSEFELEKDREPKLREILEH